MNVSAVFTLAIVALLGFSVVGLTGCFDKPVEQAAPAPYTTDEGMEGTNEEMPADEATEDAAGAMNDAAYSTKQAGSKMGDAAKTHADSAVEAGSHAGASAAGHVKDAAASTEHAAEKHAG